jgi:hypothetical protein
VIALGCRAVDEDINYRRKTSLALLPYDDITSAAVTPGDRARYPMSAMRDVIMRIASSPMPPPAGTQIPSQGAPSASTATSVVAPSAGALSSGPAASALAPSTGAFSGGTAIAVSAVGGAAIQPPKARSKTRGVGGTSASSAKVSASAAPSSAEPRGCALFYGGQYTPVGQTDSLTVIAEAHRIARILRCRTLQMILKEATDQVPELNVPDDSMSGAYYYRFWEVASRAMAEGTVGETGIVLGEPHPTQKTGFEDFELPHLVERLTNAPLARRLAGLLRTAGSRFAGIPGGGVVGAGGQVTAAAPVAPATTAAASAGAGRRQSSRSASNRSGSRNSNTGRDTIADTSNLVTLRGEVTRIWQYSWDYDGQGRGTRVPLVQRPIP